MIQLLQLVEVCLWKKMMLKGIFSLGKNKRYILGINFGPYKTQEYYNNIHNMLK